MSREVKNKDINRLRSYSSVFSSTPFSKIIKNGDLSFIEARINRYDLDYLMSGKFYTYMDYLQYIYRELEKNYRNEYFYKNTFLNSILLNHYGIKDTIAINEFRVGSSVADLVLFNGSSKAFEIKTELDSNKRLKGQVKDYRKIFDECYVVTDESLIEKYAKEDLSVGIIALRKTSRSVTMYEWRKAEKNTTIDPATLMRCLRTEEYKNIVKTFYGDLPEMNSFNMFPICSEIIKSIPPDELSVLFLNQLKKRKSSTAFLKTFHKELRQLALAMNLEKNKYDVLVDYLNRPINI